MLKQRGPEKKMDYDMLVWAICLFVENRVCGEMDWQELTRQTGYSMPHVRAVFRSRMGRPLVTYVKERRIAHAAQMLLHTQAEVLFVALRHGFASRDVFTRTFSRCTGYTPGEFRTAHPAVGQVKLCPGIYGPALPQKKITPENGE